MSTRAFHRQEKQAYVRRVWHLQSKRVDVDADVEPHILQEYVLKVLAASTLYFGLPEADPLIELIVAALKRGRPVGIDIFSLLEKRCIFGLRDVEIKYSMWVRE